MNCRHDEVPHNSMLQPIAFASKSSLGVDWYYINIGCEALEILHWLEKFNHYNFKREVCVINNHKPLVSILSKRYGLEIESHYATNKPVQAANT